MTFQTTVSIPDKQAEFVNKRGLSLSAILQNELSKRMEQSELTVEA